MEGYNFPPILGQEDRPDPPPGEYNISQFLEKFRNSFDGIWNTRGAEEALTEAQKVVQTAADMLDKLAPFRNNSPEIQNLQSQANSAVNQLSNFDVNGAGAKANVKRIVQDLSTAAYDAYSQRMNARMPPRQQGGQKRRTRKSRKTRKTRRYARRR